jgi:MYXO-CTERM domain-containing protein
MVTGSPVFISTGDREGKPLNRSLVSVNDEELGPQVVEIYPALPKGTAVPLVCLTSARRCMSAADVRAHADPWPITPLTLSGVGALVLAALLGLAAHQRRRREKWLRPQLAPVSGS